MSRPTEDEKERYSEILDDDDDDHHEFPSKKLKVAPPEPVTHAEVLG